jgi:hypothetical protein
MYHEWSPEEIRRRYAESIHIEQLHNPLKEPWNGMVHVMDLTSDISGSITPQHPEQAKASMEGDALGLSAVEVFHLHQHALRPVTSTP